MPYSLTAYVASTFIFLTAPSDTTRHAGAPAATATITTGASACEAPTLALPPSIELAPGLQPVVKWVLEHSPRFREQCRTLAAAPRLRATVSVAYGQSVGMSRARTAFRQTRAGGLDAEIEIRSASDMSELLGHEFEHLIEQLDGVDLPAMARDGEARRLVDGAFETERAIAAGQQVAGEVIDNAPDRLRRAGASLWRAVRRAARR
jgi:hypothetical protein